MKKKLIAGATAGVVSLATAAALLWLKKSYENEKKIMKINKQKLLDRLRVAGIDPEKAVEIAKNLNPDDPQVIQLQKFLYQCDDGYWEEQMLLGAKCFLEGKEEGIIHLLQEKDKIVFLFAVPPFLDPRKDLTSGDYFQFLREITERFRKDNEIPCAPAQINGIGYYVLVSSEIEHTEVDGDFQAELRVEIPDEAYESGDGLHRYVTQFHQNDRALLRSTENDYSNVVMYFKVTFEARNPQTGYGLSNEAIISFLSLLLEEKIEKKNSSVKKSFDGICFHPGDDITRVFEPNGVISRLIYDAEVSSAE